MSTSQQLPCDALYSRLSSNRSRQLVGYGGRDCAVHVFPFAGFSAVARLEGLTSPVTSLAFTPDQTSVVAGSGAGGLRLWDLATEQSTRTFLKGHTSTITDIRVHNTGCFVGTVSTDHNLRIWDTRKSSCLQSYKEARAPLRAVQFSPDGGWVATGCAHGIVRIYNLRSARMEAKLQLHEGAITSLHFHPEMRFLAVGSEDTTVSLWSIETFCHKFRSGGTNSPIDSIQLCDNRLLAASDHKLHVYSLHHPDGVGKVMDAPWTTIGDMAYVSFSDEAWFVECHGSTAMTGRMQLSKLPSPLEDCQPPTHTNTTPVCDGDGEGAQPYAIPPLRQQHPPVSNRVAGANASSTSGGIGSGPFPSTKSTTPPPQQITVTTGGTARTRIQPTLPRSQRLAAQENYVVEKPRITNDTPYNNSSGRDGTWAGSSAFRAPAPEMPMVPFVEEGGPELDVVDQLISTSAAFDKVLHRRLDHLRTIRSMWSQDQRGAVGYLRQKCEDGGEAGVVYDFLNAMQQQRMKEKMPMDALPDLLEIIQRSLNSSHEPLLLVALRTLRSMNTKFRARVDEGQRRNRMAQSIGHNDPLGMKSAGECADRFGACSVQVMALVGRRDAIGEEARYLVGELPPHPAQC